jgi:type I restriction enzyme S subunit
VCSGDIYVFESKDPNVLLPELLPFICQTDAFFDYAVGTSAGSLSPRTNWTSLAKYEFALPPLEEQERLTGLLQSLEDTMERCIEAVHVSEQLRRSFTEQFFNADPTWPALLVEELLSEGPRNGLSPKTSSSESGYRTVSISSVNDERFVADGNVKHVEIDVERVQRFFVQAGDVFVVRGNGNQSLTGRCGLADKSYEDLFYPDLLIRLRFDEKKILRQFAVHQWNAPSVHRRLIARAKSTNGIWKINGADIRNHVLAVPPLDVQQDFVTKVSTMRKAKAELVSRQLRLQTIKDSVLFKELQGAV